MRQSKTRPMAWLLAGLLAGGSAIGADPVPAPVDPAARAVIDELVTGKDKAAKKPAKPVVRF